MGKQFKVRHGLIVSGDTNITGTYQISGTPLSLYHLDDVDVTGVQTNDVLTWNGSYWYPSAVSGISVSGISSVVTDGVNLSGTGTLADPVKLREVSTDSTISGKGTPDDPLTVALAFNSIVTHTQDGLGNDLPSNINVLVTVDNNGNVVYA